MRTFTIELDAATAAFYARVAQSAGLTPERVLADALFKLAGELSLEAPQARRCFWKSLYQVIVFII